MVLRAFSYGHKFAQNQRLCTYASNSRRSLLMPLKSTPKEHPENIFNRKSTKLEYCFVGLHTKPYSVIEFPNSGLKRGEALWQGFIGCKGILNLQRHFT